MRPAHRTGAVVLGGDYQGLGIARSLGKQGVPVIIVDDERSIAKVSRYVKHTLRVPDLREEQPTLDALEQLRRTYPVEGWVLFPTRDETVGVLSRHRGELSEHFLVPTPRWGCTRFAWDKRETYGLAKRLSVPTARTWFPATESDLERIDLTTPVIIKPAIKEHFFYATRAKAWRVNTKQELLERFRQANDIIGDTGEVIVQELIPGDGGQQYSYCAFFKAGKAVASMTVRRTRQHPSDFGRASTFVETIDLADLNEPSVKFLREIGYYGLVELEYKLDPRDGQYKLLDFNARTWGYHSLGLVAGVDFPYLVYRDQIGEPVNGCASRPGVRWIRLATDVPNALVDIRAKRLRGGAYVRSLRAGFHVEAVFSLRDPLPWFYELGLLPYLAVKRGL